MPSAMQQIDIEGKLKRTKQIERKVLGNENFVEPKWNQLQLVSRMRNDLLKAPYVHFIDNYEHQVSKLTQ